MLDHARESAERDADRIDVNHEHECRYWSEKFGVSPDRLRDVVRQVGPGVSDVQRRLRDRAEEPRKA
jgi:hypothetical protein